MSDGKPIPQFLSSKVAFSVTRKTNLPFQKREFPRLTNMCLLMLSKHFGDFPTLEGVERHYKEMIFENMSTNFEMHKLAKHVDYDPFWKKACFERWKMQKYPVEHVSWQAAFFSKFLQEKIEDLEDLDRDYSDVVELLKVMAPSTFRLRIDQVKADFDLSDVIGRLVKLKYFRLSWVKKESKGMTLADATNVANLIGVLKELETLELACNKIDDDGIKILMKTMEDHPTLKEVSLCHNKLGNVGARRAARIFGKNKNVISINLSNNHIGYEGARCISTVLSEPSCQLRHLNLSLNLISDKAVSSMIQDLMENKKLLSLDLSSNLLTDECVPLFKQYIVGNKTLTSLKLSCNKFSLDSFPLFKDCLDKNGTLNLFEAYNTDMPSEKQIELAEIITRKAVERKGQTFISTVAVTKYLDDQRRAKEAKDHIGEIVEEEIPSEGKKDKEQKPVEAHEVEQQPTQEDRNEHED